MDILNIITSQTSSIASICVMIVALGTIILNNYQKNKETIYVDQKKRIKKLEDDGIEWRDKYYVLKEQVGDLTNKLAALDASFQNLKCKYDNLTQNKGDVP